MDQLIQFFYEGNKPIRSVLVNDDPWFVAKDVCDVLDIANSRDAVGRLDDDERGVVSTDTLGGNQEMQAVNESGLYSLVLGSRKPEAKAFKRWITHEVIPSIRRHGAYLTPSTIEEVLLNPDTIIKIATQLKVEQEERKRLEAQVIADRPKVLFAEALEVSDNAILIGELAKILKQNGINIGPNRLFEQLRQDGYLMRARGDQWNDPTQYAMELGLFEIKKRTINNPDGSVRTTKTTKVTAKGQVFLVNKFLEKRFCQ